MAGRKPDYKLKVLNKDTDDRCNDAGAGWKNKDGSITIVLAACIHLTSDRTYLIKLFPAEWKDDKRQAKIHLPPDEEKNEEDPF